MLMMIVGWEEQFQEISIVGQRIVVLVCSTCQRRVLVSLLCCEILYEENGISSSSPNINTDALDEEGNFS
jgi:hypothetical protein